MADYTSSGRSVERTSGEETPPVYYSNSIEIGLSVYDIMLVLGRTIRSDNEKIVINQVARVMMSPQHARVLAKLLDEKLEQYESMFGPIPASQEPERAVESIEKDQPEA